jgi:hypothetical protein
MSKHKEATVEPPVAMVKEIPPPPKPGKVAIGTCLGKMVECPACGKPAYVTDARGARTLTQVVSSKWWVLAKCTGYCGNVLRRSETDMVTVLPESQPVPVFKSLGAAVGHWILCPRENCGAKSQAQWSMDEAHTINCPECGCRPYPSETQVEMVG